MLYEAFASAPLAGAETVALICVSERACVRVFHGLPQLKPYFPRRRLGVSSTCGEQIDTDAGSPPACERRGKKEGSSRETRHKV